MAKLEPCISPHCALCTFELCLHDRIVAAHLDTPETIELTYRPCSWACKHPHGRTTACHKSCHSYAGTPSPVLCAATRCGFDPLPSTSMVDARSLSDNLAKAVREKYQKHKLPLELCRQIAEHLVCPWSATCTKAYLPPKPQPVQVNMSSEIWASFIKFHNRPYISALSNHRIGSTRKILLYSPESTSALDTIYVAHDAWGIKRIIFTSSTSKLDVDLCAGIWWQTLPIHAKEGLLLLQSDGFKLRNLRYSLEDRELDTSNRMWSIPQSPAVPPQLYSLKGSVIPARMTSLIINDAKVTGYSVCYNSEIVAVQAHRQGEDLSYYAILASQYRLCAWLYMPVDDGEWISEVWLRDRQFPRQAGLVVSIKPQLYNYLLTFPKLVTSRGRTQTMAYHPKPASEDYYSYRMVAVLPKEPSSLIVDVMDSTMLSHKRTLCIPRPLSNHPRCTSCEDFFYSHAQLEDVYEIMPCRIGRAVTGLVLRYSNGNRASLGQVRLDHLEPPERVDESVGMWLLISETRNQFPRVTDIRLNRSLANMDSYFELQWCGVLEWWFSGRQCQLSYRGRVTKATRF